MMISLGKQVSERKRIGLLFQDKELGLEVDESFSFQLNSICIIVAGKTIDLSEHCIPAMRDEVAPCIALML